MIAALDRDFGLAGHHRADAVETVGADRHPDAGAADQNAAIGSAGRNQTPDLNREIGIVIGRIEHMRAGIDHLIALALQRVAQLVLEFETAVVGTDGDGQLFLVVKIFHHMESS
ncbi:hypothetical protein SDC9_172573 [bioreactor metagenome]|uniref:Uncharacterized protein n=1 Tax=bioreactor metagenome TaxID=1076179 RepID=A0A645GG65_9ZZZZ